MPAFTGNFSWDKGIIWKIGFIDPSSFDPNNPNNPDFAGDQIHICNALVDTGASRTCISRAVIDSLGLQPMGKAGVQTAAGPIDANAYDVHVAFLLGIEQNPDGTTSYQAQMTNKMANTQALEFDAGKSEYQGLIGLDILKEGVLTVSFDGHFSFSY